MPAMSRRILRLPAWLRLDDITRGPYPKRPRAGLVIRGHRRASARDRTV
jgi:hypothetical protein